MTGSRNSTSLDLDAPDSGRHPTGRSSTALSNRRRVSEPDRLRAGCLPMLRDTETTVGHRSAPLPSCTCTAVSPRPERAESDSPLLSSSLALASPAAQRSCDPFEEDPGPFSAPFTAVLKQNSTDTADIRSLRRRASSPTGPRSRLSPSPLLPRDEAPTRDSRLDFRRIAESRIARPSSGIVFVNYTPRDAVELMAAVKRANGTV